MNKKEIKFVEKWSKIRKRGIFLFVLRSMAITVLGWFIGSFIGLSSKNNSMPTINYVFTENYLVLFGLLTVGIIGSIMGWRIEENRYKELEK